MGPSVLELREAIAPQIESYDEPRILINFEHVNMIDSSGLGALMEARAIANRKNGRIGVIHVSKHIKNLVVLSRLVSMFEHYDNEDAAVSRTIRIECSVQYTSKGDRFYRSPFLLSASNSAIVRIKIQGLAGRENLPD